jgi:hypothetical protein
MNEWLPEAIEKIDRSPIAQLPRLSTYQILHGWAPLIADFERRPRGNEVRT